MLAGFVWPAQGPISGVYGSQRFYNGEPRNPHYGVDGCPRGTLVRAPAAGGDPGGAGPLFSGGTVILDHGYRLSSHLPARQAVSVQVGDELGRAT